MNRIIVLLIAAGMLVLAACGSSSDRDIIPEGSSDWDRMVWDQDDWA